MPLSEHEQRALDELAQRIAAEDPEFGRRVPRPGQPGPTWLYLANAIAGLLVGLGLLAAFCLTTTIILGVASFLVMFASLYALWTWSADRVERAWADASATTRVRRAHRPRRQE